MKKITFLSLTIILSLSLLLFSGCLYEEASSSDSNQENVQTIVEIGNSSTLQKELLDGGDFILTTDLETKGIDVPVGSVSSVNLGGYTLSAELREESETHYYAISNYRELTLYGEGVISGRAIRNYGTLILEGFTVFGTDGDFPVIYNEGEIYIKDVNLSNLALGNECDGQTASVINNLGKLFMENSQVSSENLYYPAIYTANSFEMKDCLVTSQTCALLVSKELAVISSSTVSSKGADSVVVESGYLKVLSGQFSHLESSYAINVVESGSTLELDEIVLDNKINYSDANIVKRLSTVEQVQNALTAGNSVVLKEDLFILAFILCCFLPYVFIGRVMFMYHYFPVLPFLMLAIVALIKMITEKIKNNSFYLFYVAIVILLFICFYPVVSGMMTTTDYIDSLRWFDSWYF